MKNKLTRAEFARQIEASRIYLSSKSKYGGYDLNNVGGFCNNNKPKTKRLTAQ